MGRQKKITGSRKSITWQAAVRLLLSLGLFVILVSASSALLYRTALQKSAQERSEDLKQFYRQRVQQLEREWELQTRDFKTRIEYTRYLEQSASAEINLRAFFTIQGGERRFSHLEIRNPSGELLFKHGQDALGSSTLQEGMEPGWYLHPRTRQLYRVFKETIWLGKQGSGVMLAYFPIDRALLYQLSVPGIILKAQYLGEAVAGSVGTEKLQRILEEGEFEQVILPWLEDRSTPMQIVIEVPVRGIFSTLELAAGIGLIPVLDALILWFVLGTWLMLQARRIRALDLAVLEFARSQENTPILEKEISRARSQDGDEIDDVAVAVESLALQTVEQRNLRQSNEEELRKYREHLEKLVSERTVELESANKKLVQQREMLITSESELRQAQSVAKIGSWSLDMRHGTLKWSDETYRIFGLEPGTPMMYERFLELVHEDDLDRVDASWRAALSGKPYCLDHRIRVGSEIKWVREQAELVFDESGKVESGIGTVQDITELKRYEEKIEQMAFYDALTGLPNRRMLYDRLNHVMATGKRSRIYSALMFLDLDNFKPINDTHGHVMGDQLLLEVAQRLTASIRETDTVARFGGDEFVLLLCDLDRNLQMSTHEAMVLADKIRVILGQPYWLGEAGGVGVEHRCTPSIGVVMFHGTEHALDEIIHRADAAMYQSKIKGKNQVTLDVATAE